jgi:acyl carrier protein
MTTIEEKARQIIAEQLGVNLDEVTPKAKLSDDLGADSLDVIEIVMQFEEEFDLDISDDELEGLVPNGTVEQALAYLNAKLHPKAKGE